MHRGEAVFWALKGGRSLHFDFLLFFGLIHSFGGLDCHFSFLRSRMNCMIYDIYDQESGKRKGL